MNERMNHIDKLKAEVDRQRRIIYNANILRKDADRMIRTAMHHSHMAQRKILELEESPDDAIDNQRQQAGG